MRLDERDKGHLWDILDAALAVDEFVRGRTYEEYLSNRMIRGAVERHIEIIGEAARRVSEETKRAHPGIPWRAIVGQRNVLAHQYDAVDHHAIWAVAVRRIPELSAAVKAILRDFPAAAE
jgi:uncharacterized protein with HEPN domain